MNSNYGVDQGLNIGAGAVSQGPTQFPSGSSIFTFKSADETRGVVAPADDADLQFVVKANRTYQIRGLIISTQARDDIGSNVIFTNGATLAMTVLAIRAYVNRLRTAGGSAGLTTGTDVQSYKFQMLDASPWNPTGGATIAACQNYYYIDGLFRPSAAGTFALRWWPQNAAGPVTLKAGSYLELIDTGV